jgi:hypothetical protein
MPRPRKLFSPIFDNLSNIFQKLAITAHVCASRGPEESLVTKVLKEAEAYQLLCHGPIQQFQKSSPNLSQEYMVLVSASQAVHGKADLYPSSRFPQVEISEVFNIRLHQQLPIAPSY